MSPSSSRCHSAIALAQASQESPTLAHLIALTRESSERLEAITPLIPLMLRPALRALARLMASNSAYWSTATPQPPKSGNCCPPSKPICAAKGGRLLRFG